MPGTGRVRTPALAATLARAAISNGEELLVLYCINEIAGRLDRQELLELAAAQAILAGQLGRALPESEQEMALAGFEGPC